VQLRLVMHRPGGKWLSDRPSWDYLATSMRLWRSLEMAF
jgi:hypothetical protein